MHDEIGALTLEILVFKGESSRIEDCAKDGGEEFFTEMHCVL